MATLHEHAHFDLTGARLVSAARDALEAQGEQWTEMRADVFAALAACERPASAYDIAESVGKIRLRKGGINASFTVRRIASNNIGVERTYLLNSPRIDRVEVTRHAKVRAPPNLANLRANLF